MTIAFFLIEITQSLVQQCIEHDE